METYIVTPGGEYYPRHHQDQYQEQTQLGDQEHHQEHHQDHRRHESGDKQGEQAGQARQQVRHNKEDNLYHFFREQIWPLKWTRENDKIRKFDTFDCYNEEC